MGTIINKISNYEHKGKIVFLMQQIELREKLADTAQANNAFCLLDEVAEAAESEYVALQKVFDHIK